MASHSPTASGRRRFTPEFKQHVVELTLHPGTSVAGIALAHQLNAHQVFTWRREYLRQRAAQPVAPPALLLPVELVAEQPPARVELPPVPAPVGTIDIEISGAQVRVSGNVDPAVLRTVLASLRGR